MKYRSLLLHAFVFSVALISCSDDNEIVAPARPQPNPQPNPQPVVNTVVEFATTRQSIDENSNGFTTQVKLSKPAVTNVTIVAKIDVENESGITTIPAMNNGLIEISIPANSDFATLTIIPANNTTLDGDFDGEISLLTLPANFEKGIRSFLNLTVKDDELANKPKGFDTGNGSWGLAKEFEYDIYGRIHKVHIKESTPEPRLRTETYFYNDNGGIEKVNLYPSYDRLFIYENNKVVKSHDEEYGVVKKYSEYDYDSEGNVSGMATYHLQPDNSYVMTSLIVFLYYTDGNLYKSMTYIPGATPEDLQLISTKTYEGYTEHINHFPMVEIIPGISAQKNLFTSYRLEEAGFDFQMTLSYEFNAAGQALTRTVSGSGIFERAHYSYY